MGDVVNLNRFRKRAARAQAEKTADENRAHFGRSKKDRDLDQRRRDQATKQLDGHLIDRGDA